MLRIYSPPTTTLGAQVQPLMTGGYLQRRLVQRSAADFSYRSTEVLIKAIDSVLSLFLCPFGYQCNLLADFWTEPEQGPCSNSTMINDVNLHRD